MSNCENFELNNSDETTSCYCENCGEFNIYGACSNCEWQPNYDYFDFDDWLNIFEQEIEQQNEQNEQIEQNEDDGDDDSDVISDDDEAANKNIEIDETRITSPAA